MDTTEEARGPKCRRCRNHGIIVPQKGHAKFCPLLRCTCWRCHLATQRTHIGVQERYLQKTQNPEAARAQAGVARRLVLPTAEANGGARAIGGLPGVPFSGPNMVQVPHGPQKPAQGPNQAVRKEVPCGVPPLTRPVFGDFGPTAPLPFFHVPVMMPGPYPGSYAPSPNFLLYVPPMPAGLYNRPTPPPVNQPAVMHFPPQPGPGPSADGGRVVTAGPFLPESSSEEPPVQTPHPTMSPEQGLDVEKILVD